jgi:hypothetical protein
LSGRPRSPGKPEAAGADAALGGAGLGDWANAAPGPQAAASTSTNADTSDTSKFADLTDATEYTLISDTTEFADLTDTTDTAMRFFMRARSRNSP